MAGRGKSQGNRRGSRSRSGSGSSGGCGPTFCWRAGGRGQERLEYQELLRGARGELLQAASGERHYLLLLSSGAVLACGDNSCGQLGSQGVKHEERPVPIRAVKTLQFAFVSCGKDFSLAICHRGKVFAWGSNYEGQLGIDGVNDRLDTPRKIKSLADIKIIQVSCGNHHSLALSEGSQVYSWGSNSHGQLGLGKEVPSQNSPQLVKSLKGIPLAQVAAGGDHSFALSLSGTSFGWGKNNVGQLALSGNNKKAEQIHKPFAVGALQELGVTYISCGGEHTAVLTQDEKVYTFGDNTYGQLGNSSAARSGPQAVEGISGPVSQIDCASKHTLVYVYTTGQVVSFGCGPSQTSNPAYPEALAENSNINCLISADDSLNVHVKHIFAGTYVNFVTTYQAKSSSIPKKILPEISSIDQSLTEKWTREQNAKLVENAIETIFSSPACLTASFLKKREPKESSIGVDLQMARETFTTLTKNEKISSLITTSLGKKLVRDLPYHSKHREALLVFLLLPECPVMHESSNRESLVVPFAKAICEMNDKSLCILQKWWNSLPTSTLNTLVQMLKTALVSVLLYWINSTQNHHSATALLRVMEKVYKVNKKATCQLPESAFYIDQLSDCMNFIEERKAVFLRDQHARAKAQWGIDFNNLVIFSDYPFIFNLVCKIKLWQADSIIKKILTPYLELELKKFLIHFKMFSEGLLELPPPPNFKLMVRKCHLVEDTLRQLESAEVTDLQKELLVGIADEIRPKSGGVLSEFFHAVFEEMTSTHYRMFIYPEEGSSMWFPANKPGFEEKKKYYLFGILCGLSFYNANVANIPFPLALFKKLMDQKPSLEDLKELSPVLGKKLQEFLNYEADDIEDLSIYFNVHWDQNDVDLIPNGSSTLVDHTNKKDFVSECVNYIFNTSVNVVYEEFQRGFYKVCDKKLIKQFQPEELRQAIIGNTDYDWEEFEKNSVYEGYNPSHPTIRMFWEVFHELSLEEKKKFLFFLTGNDRLEVKGLRKIGIHFRYSELLRESDNLRSLICHYILDLPNYSTMERMRDALRVAINNNTGFDSSIL